MHAAYLVLATGNILCIHHEENIIKTTQTLKTSLMAMVPALLAMTVATAPAHAQQYQPSPQYQQGQQGQQGQAYAPVIRGFDVEEVRRLQPGVELNFNLYGTPGGRATLSIEGARRNLTLSETDPGVYEGTYTLGTRDRVTGNSAVTANLRLGNQVTSGVLSESLLRSVGSHARNGRA